jgi:Zn-dependent M28 family amino/carboxypeptidase
MRGVNLKFRYFKFAIVILALITPALFAQNGNGAGPAGSTIEEIESEFGSVPCKDDERLNAVKMLFEKMGAKKEEIIVEKFKNVENVVVKMAGAENSPEKIVIGAHYDKTEQGCGAVDNWTGIVALAHIYRALKETMPNKTVVFVAFGKEEKGLVGSAAMTAGIKKEQAAEYCAMINIDSIGLDRTEVAENLSSKKLIALSAKIAKEMNLPFARGYLNGGDSDSTSFINKKIPALTIHALGNNWRQVLHTPHDQAAKVKMESVFGSYRLALALLDHIDKSDCRAFR